MTSADELNRLHRELWEAAYRGEGEETPEFLAANEAYAATYRDAPLWQRIKHDLGGRG